MAIITRQITGPIETPEHEVVILGVLRVSLLHPIADDDTFIAPFKLEYAITSGALPVGCKLTAPAKYEFRVEDELSNKIWTFQACLFDDSPDPISIAQLWLLSKLEQGSCSPLCEGLDAANLGSNGSSAGWVLTADGEGGADWLPITGSGIGDMLKSVYDTNYDGRVNAADHALVADFADDSDLLGGHLPSYYQRKLPNGSVEGAILTWDVLNQFWLPNNNFLVGDDGSIQTTEINVGGPIYLGGPLYGNVSSINQIYYEVDDETHILVVIEDDAEIVLPNATLEDRRVINIKKESTTAYDVLVTVMGGGLIEGMTTYRLKHQYDAITCVAINGEWWIY
jgi:hypothetical protein